MYKLRFIYICDHCGKVELPEVVYCGIDAVNIMPHNWGWLGKAHLCDECYAAYRKLMDEPEKPRNRRRDANHEKEGD